MLSSEPIVAFVHTSRPAEARRFYAEVLGLQLIEDSPFALDFAAAGTTVRVAKVETHSPLPGTVLGWKVANVIATVRALGAAGVKFERFEGMEQDELGVWVPPGGTSGVAWFKDPDGNVLSVSGR